MACTFPKGSTVLLQLCWLLASFWLLRFWQMRGFITAFGSVLYPGRYDLRRRPHNALAHARPSSHPLSTLILTTIKEIPPECRRSSFAPSHRHLLHSKVSTAAAPALSLAGPSCCTTRIVVYSYPAVHLRLLLLLCGTRRRRR